MPRTTAAERREEFAFQRALQDTVKWEVFVKNYHVRFAALLFAFSADPELRVKKLDDQTYTFSLPEEDWRTRSLYVNPPEAFDYEYELSLEHLEAMVEDLAAERAEADRKFRVKTAALAKLNKEERELLGL